MDTLCEQAASGNRGRDLASELPRSQSDHYQRSLLRILGRDEPDKSVAIVALTWICFAARPLTFEEFKYALTIHKNWHDPDTQYFQPENEERLIAICDGLVVIRGDGDLSMIHYTAQEYLKGNAGGVFREPEAHAQLAESCLNCLRLRPTAQPILGSSQPPDDARRRATGPAGFYTYAADHWGYHVRRSRREHPVWDCALRFLRDGDALRNSLRSTKHHELSLQPDATPLHVATFLGSRTLVQLLLDEGSDKKAVTGMKQTALHWAAFFGNARVLKLLLDKGADLLAEDFKGRTPLHLAVMYAHKKCVEILLDTAVRTGRDGLIDKEDRERWTPLRRAADNGDHYMTSLLLERRADADAECQHGFTAMRCAAGGGHNAIVERLIRAGASVDKPTRDGWTVIAWAAETGRFDIASLLIQRKAQLNSQSWNQDTPLALALKYGHGLVAWQLIEAGARIEPSEDGQHTMLHSAIRRLHTWKDRSVIWVIVEKAAGITGGINRENGNGETPLHVAASVGDASLVWLLLGRGANTRAVTKNGRTTLHAAAESGSELIIKKLVAGGLDRRVVDKDGQTPLHLAIIGGHEAAAMSLVLSKRDLSHTDALGQTALHVAAYRGRAKLVHSLIRKGAEVDRADGQGKTPLHRAVSKEEVDSALCLIKIGRAGVNIRDRDGFTALHEAARVGNQYLVDVLMSVKGDKTCRNGAGETPVQVARGNGHVHITWARWTG